MGNVPVIPQQGVVSPRNVRLSCRVALLAGTALVAAGISSGTAIAQTVLTAANAADLSADITTVNANPDTSYVINLTGPITLTTALPAINTGASLSISGAAGPGGGPARFLADCKDR